MPSTSKTKAEAKAEAKTEAPKINCPVIGCWRNLVLQPHPRIKNRLIAVCRCDDPRNGMPVYETDAPKTAPAEAEPAEAEPAEAEPVEPEPQDNPTEEVIK